MSHSIVGVQRMHLDVRNFFIYLVLLIDPTINYSSSYRVCGSGAGLGKSSEVWRFFLGPEKRWERVKCTGDPPSCRDGHSWTYIGTGFEILYIVI